MSEAREIWGALVEAESRDLDLTSVWVFRERENLWSVSLHVRGHATRYRAQGKTISAAFSGAAALCMQETCQDKG